MNNRYYIIVTVLIGTIITLNSCKKFLDTQPKNFISPVSFYKNDAQLSAALGAVYEPLTRGNVYGTTLVSDGITGTDECFYNDVSLTSGIAVNNFTPQDVNVNGLWNALYLGIDRASSLLENTSDPLALAASGIDTAKARVVNAEALFLRSYYYFMLVSYYGDVPLRLSSTQSVTENVFMARTPSNTVYDQITKDMIYAESRVNTIQVNGNGGRISQSAVDGILARVYLYWSGYPLNNTAKYADALLWANKARSNTYHSLNPSYRNIFINHEKDIYEPKESMWEVEFNWQGASAIANKGGNLGIRNGILCSSLDTGFAYGLINTTQKLFNAYGGTVSYSIDNRRDWTIANYKLNGANTMASPLRQSIAASTIIYDRDCGKWRRDFETFVPRDKNNNGVNLALLRYADVLLMSAEADNELNGPTSAAIAAINSIRERAIKGVKAIAITKGGSGYTTAPKVTITGGGGSSASATAVISGGIVTAVNITYSGYEYSSAPTVTIDPPASGTGATASATILTIADADLTTAQTSSQPVFRQVIQDERMRELSFEGFRRFDLIRWGIYIQTLKQLASDIRGNANASYKFGAVAGENVTQRNVLWPIPLSEISANKLAVQNPGW